MKKRKLILKKKKNESLINVLGILEKTTGVNEDNKTIEEKKK